MRAVVNIDSPTEPYLVSQAPVAFRSVQAIPHRKLWFQRLVVQWMTTCRVPYFDYPGHSDVLHSLAAPRVVLLNQLWASLASSTYLVIPSHSFLRILQKLSLYGGMRCPEEADCSPQKVEDLSPQSRPERRIAIVRSILSSPRLFS